MLPQNPVRRSWICDGEGMSSTLSRDELQAQLRAVLPEEGMNYLRLLNDKRFARHSGADQLFFKPTNVVELLAKACAHRGGLDGCDRHRLIAEGADPAAFELPAHYRYLTVPAEGRVGILSIDELPHWVPVTLRSGYEPHNRIGFRRAANRNPEQHLAFTIDPDFQREANQATIILAPNWFGENPTTEMAVLDCFLGLPVPSSLQSIPADSDLAQAEGLKDGSELSVAQLRGLLPGRPLWLACQDRNLPGT